MSVREVKNPETVAVVARAIVRALEGAPLSPDERLEALKAGAEEAVRDIRRHLTLECVIDAYLEGLEVVEVADVLERLQEKRLTAGPGVTEILLRTLSRGGVLVRKVDAATNVRTFALADPSDHVRIRTAPKPLTSG